MAHKCAYTYSVMAQLFLDSGFMGVFGGRRVQAFDRPIEAELKALAMQYLPP
jgi:hypothetical protein